MIAAAEQARSRMVYLISLDTLEYLYKGGRIGGARRFIGTMLNGKRTRPPGARSLLDRLRGRPAREPVAAEPG